MNPVTLAGSAATVSGVPSATISPPRAVASSHFDHAFAVGQPFCDCWPSRIQPCAQASIAHVAATQPDQPIFDRRITQCEIVILRHERQAVPAGVPGNIAVRRLSAEHIANMRRFMAAIFEPAVERLRQLCVDQEVHAA